jgi:hypothetical protein
MLEAKPRAASGGLSVPNSEEEDRRDQDQGPMFEVNQLGEDRRLVSQVETRRGEARRRDPNFGEWWHRVDAPADSCSS